MMKKEKINFRPRLSVYRSHRSIYAQIIDDTTGKTLVAANNSDVQKDLPKAQTKVDAAFLVGEFIAKKAQKAKIEKIVFDRGKYRYHGRVKALAEGARKGGLIF